MIKKIIFSFIATIILAMSSFAVDSWNGTIGCSSFGGGTGSASDPYIIENELHLDHLHKFLPLNSNGSGMYFKLTNHIDLRRVTWEPIPFFSGTLDGAGYTISNLLINAGTKGGFFIQTNSATIMNLGIVGNSFISGYPAGTFASYAYGTTIRNCYSMASVVGNNSAGFVSYATNCTFENCYNTGSISGNHAGTSAGVGGIVGTMVYGGIIRNCYNTGTIINNFGGTHMGGLVGLVQYTGTWIVENSYNVGTIINASSNTGAIIGNVAISDVGTSLTITNCHFDNQISIINKGIGTMSAASSSLISGNPQSKNLSEMYSVFSGNTIFVTNPNFYPQLAVFANSSIDINKRASAVSVIPIRLVAGQNANNIDQNFEVPSQTVLLHDIHWTCNNNVISVKDGTTTAFIHDVFSNKLLTATHNGLSRNWMLSTAVNLIFSNTLTIDPYPSVHGTILINGNAIDRNTYKFISPSSNLIDISAKADAGYKFQQWTNALSSTTLPTTINIDGNKTLGANFSAFGYSLTATVNDGGTMNNLGTITVASASNQTYTILPYQGHYIKEVKIDGTVHVSSAISGTYTFTNISTNHTIDVTFAPGYIITSSAGTGGAITTAGRIIVSPCSTETFTITPNIGYRILDVKIDGVSNAAAITDKTYTFTNITAIHTIDATFVLNTYNITATAGTGGTITPSGTVTINSGSDQKFTFKANTGYKLSDIKIDGTSHPTVITTATYEFTNIIADHTIEVIFELIPITTYNITATAGTGGTITPSGTITVNSGSNPKFTFKANTGYKLSGVRVNGVNNTASLSSESYTFINVNRNQTIAVSFTKTTTPTTTYNLTIQTPQNGKIQVNYVSNGITVNEIVSTIKIFSNIDSGTNVTLTAQPNTGYTFIRWIGSILTATTSTTLVVNGNKSVAGIFAPPTIPPVNGDKIVVLWGKVLAVHNKENDSQLENATYRWYKDGEPLLGNQFYVELGNPIPAGTYTVDVFNNGVKTQKLQYIISNKNTKIYPNPLSINNTLYIETEAEKIKSCKIYDVTGRQSNATMNLTDKGFFIENVPLSGMYFIHVEYSGHTEIVKLLVY